jgi:hypothetical protein
MVLIKYVYGSNSNAKPALLHDIRSAVLNAERLALSAVRHGLHRYIAHASPKLFKCVDAFVEEAYAVVRRVMEEENRVLNLGSARPPLEEQDAWDIVVNRYAFGLDRISAPKVLSDVFESVMAAVWLDSGTDFARTWSVAHKLLAPLPGSAIGLGNACTASAENTTPNKDSTHYDENYYSNRVPIGPLRRLYEFAASKGEMVKFRVLNDGDDVMTEVLMGDKSFGIGPPAPTAPAATRLAAQAVVGTLGFKPSLGISDYR